MRFIITAGPTREPIDAVRFITNASSGKMGVALAQAAVERGHDVTLVCGPISVPAPDGVKVIWVETVDEMIDAVLGEIEKGCDVLISAAAISDYKPEKISEIKVKSDRKITLELVPTRKLTKTVREKHPQVFTVAFKAEYGIPEKELIDRAYSKLVRENLDLIIANDLKEYGFGSDETSVHVVDAKRNVITLPKEGKAALAIKIIDHVIFFLSPEGGRRMT